MKQQWFYSLSTAELLIINNTINAKKFFCFLKATETPITTSTHVIFLLYLHTVQQIHEKTWPRIAQWV
jgi:hypothetical protein